MDFGLALWSEITTADKRLVLYKKFWMRFLDCICLLCSRLSTTIFREYPLNGTWQCNVRKRLSSVRSKREAVMCPSINITQLEFKKNGSSAFHGVLEKQDEISFGIKLHVKCPEKFYSRCSVHFCTKINVFSYFCCIVVVFTLFFCSVCNFRQTQHMTDGQL